ncbi:DUF4145 domain-containing protein [Salinibacterium sp. ZJ450]|uniref:DUF4145 domain-containing protein n=1 Tax=Salinibacterium sp. ZJ450 TaxID=2708338 RepID=UPI001422C200|nr:DUF4145 domain-containing protein [Salinibacterium sp. ZJ450]
MPAAARELYTEAADVLAISKRAATARASATLERLLRELDPDAGKVSLADRIDPVLGRVSTPLDEMLAVIRHVGNKSLHVEDEPDDVTMLVLDPNEEEIVELIFESINDLVDELITRPARSRAICERVPERVRAMVGKAVGAATA